VRVEVADHPTSAVEVDEERTAPPSAAGYVETRRQRPLGSGQSESANLRDANRSPAEHPRLLERAAARIGDGQGLEWRPRVEGEQAQEELYLGVEGRALDLLRPAAQPPLGRGREGSEGANDPRREVFERRGAVDERTLAHATKLPRVT
jgi:hypothetical protein